MPLAHWNPHPSPRQLQQFGWLCLVVLPLLGWWWSAPTAVFAALAGAGLAAALLGLWRPMWLRPIFLLLALLTLPIGLAVGELALMIVFFLLITPIGLLLSRLRTDPLQRNLDASATSYFQKKRQPAEPDRYFRQF